MFVCILMYVRAWIHTKCSRVLVLSHISIYKNILLPYPHTYTQVSNIMGGQAEASGVVVLEKKAATGLSLARSLSRSLSLSHIYGATVSVGSA